MLHPFALARFGSLFVLPSLPYDRLARLTAFPQAIARQLQAELGDLHPEPA